jgi:hypothetical protein
MTFISLFFNTVLTLFVVLLLNQVLRRFLPKAGLSSGELLMIYVMLTTASAMAGTSFMQKLMPLMVHAFWHATPENDFEALFHHHLPTWLTVRDMSALTDYHKGYTTFYTAKHIEVWIRPVLSWTGFIFVLVFIMLCINVVVRKQWVEQEKLAYPMIQLPYEMISQRFSFFRSRLMWIGFAIAATIDLLNGLHHLWPDVPGLSVKATNTFNLGRYLVSKPWNAIGWMPFSLYPFVIGLGFFIPLDLSFSMWFFFLFWKAQRILWSALGFPTLGGYAASGYRSINEQTSGAYLAVFVVAMWVSRRHIGLFVRKILGRKSAIDDSDEPMSYRTAALGIVIGSILLLVFCYQAGMSLWLAVPFFAIYYALITSITRMRAELGVPVHDMHGGGLVLQLLTPERCNATSA